MKTDNLRALPVNTEISDYRIHNVLGFGGFGITYLAIDIKLDLKVAIKEYFPREFAVRAHGTQVKPAGSIEDRDTFKWGLERFLQEARVLARFRHPNIVSVTRFFEENGTAYLVMDYCEGRPLDQVFEHEGKLSHSKLCLIIPPLLDALERVHRTSLLHRDIKPANIFLREDNSPVLLDFGAARHELIEHSRSVTSLVTANYSSIEQYSTHGKQGPWSDIYSLGATLYRAVTGIKLQDAPDRMLDDQVKPSVSLEGAGYPRALLQAIDSAIKVRPQDRPQSVTEWRELFGSSLEQGYLENPQPELRLSTGSADQVKVKSTDTGETDRKFIFGMSLVGTIAGVMIFFVISGNRTPDKKAEPVPAPQSPIAKNGTANDDKKETKIARSEPPSGVVKSLPKCVGDDPLKFHACIGARTDASGVKYTGEFQYGRESGKGEAVWPSGQRYVGDFRDGVVNGEGKFFLTNGDTWEGTFKDWKANGKGTYRWKSGQVFQGTYVMDVREGRGNTRLSNGDTYEVVYRNDKPTNPATVRLVSGDSYIGDVNWETRLWEGRGTYRYKGGTRYVGDFKDGYRHGNGIEYDSSGTITRNGRWDKDQFLGGP